MPSPPHEYCATDNQRDADLVLNDVLAPALNRDPRNSVDLPIGSAQHCSEVLAGIRSRRRTRGAALADS